MAATSNSPSVTDAISYDDLYARWERGNWCATELDFTQDAIDWREKMTADQRRSALWIYTLFFHGEDSVTDNLSPYIDAAPLEEQKYFLATQQVDEARHSVFFHRFMREVVGVGGDSIASTLRATDDQITWGHRKVFTRLDRMARELRADRSPRKLAAAITLYHIIIEASLAQPGQHLIEQSLETYDVLPAFRQGMANVSLDEQRHIGFGVKLLADLRRDDPEVIEAAIVETLAEVLPWTVAVAKPPNWDETYTTAFGFTVEDLAEQGAIALEQRLRAIGLDVANLKGVPVRMDLAPRERGEVGIRLLRANLIGPDRPARRDPESVALLFDALAYTANADAVPGGATIQWEFTDVDPWYLRLANGSTHAQQGRVEDPDLVFRCSFTDWVDVTAGRADARVLMLRRRLRPRGSLTLLRKLPRIFG